MATYTENYSLVKPGYGDQADIDVLNRLMTDKVDALLFENRRISADEYDRTESYAVGDYAIYENVLYKCIEDTTGNFDPSKWEMTNLAKELSTKGGADVTKTASGNPITFDDGADAPMVKCVTEIQGSQDLHGYDKPWVGGAGKNKFDTFYRTGAKLDYETGVITSSSNQSLGRIVPKANTAYTVSVKDTTGTDTSKRINMAFYDVNDTPLSVTTKIYKASEVTSASCTIQPVADSAYLYFSVYDVSTEIQCEEGEIATSYEPYSNICPITAYTEGEIEVRGKNLFDKNASDIAVGYYLIASTGVLSPSQSGYNTSGYIPIEPNTDYTKSGASVAADEYCFFDSEKTFISGLSRTDTTVLSPNNAAYMRFDYKASETDNIQIEKGSTATTYEPYTSTTHTTTYPSAIFRGSEDVVNGEVTSEMPVIDLGDLTWTYDSTYARFQSSEIADMKKGDSRTIRLYSSCYESLWHVEPFNANWDSVIYNGIYRNVANICVHDHRYTDATAFKTAVTGQTLAYKLATPTTSSVTPTNLPIKSLSGYNHIESSTGEMEVEYITSEFQPLVDLIEANSGGESEENHEYSTTAKKVGTWIDGRDIYEIVYTGTFSISSTGTTIGETLPNGCTVLSAQAVNKTGHGDGGCVQCTPLVVMENNTNSTFTVYSNWSWNVDAKAIIIQYIEASSQTRSLSKSAPIDTKTEDLSSEEEIPEEIKNAEYEEKPDVNEADDDAPTEVDER